MIDGGSILRDQLVALAATNDSAAKGTTSEWWRVEIMRLVDDYDNFTEFLRHGEEEMMPKLAGSGFVMSIMPDGKVDAKFSMELGAAIMYDKPIIALAPPGVKIPDALRRVAHDIVEIDLKDPASQDRAGDKIREILDQLIEDGVIPGDDGVVSDD